MYAPITNPAAAERIPEKAALAELVLNNITIPIKSAVDEIDPRATTAYVLRISPILIYRSPLALNMTIPTVSIIAVIMIDESAAEVKYDKTICHLLTGVANISLSTLYSLSLTMIIKQLYGTVIIAEPIIPDKSIRSENILRSSFLIRPLKAGMLLRTPFMASTNVLFKNMRYNPNTMIDVSIENSIDCLSLKNTSRFLFVNPIYIFIPQTPYL
jgi:hypothetical protein